MKRFLHALAALWPKKRATGSPPLGDPSTAIPQHLAAVLRMEGILGECADLRICKSANETLGAVALNERSVLDVGLNLSEREQSNFANHQINDSTTRRLTESIAHQINDSTTRRLVDSPNHPTSLPRIPQPMPLLTILMLVFFMCLMAAKQVSAQAEPADAAVFDDKPYWIEHIRDPRTINHILRVEPDADLEMFPLVKYHCDFRDVEEVRIGDTLPDYFWNLPLRVVNQAQAHDTITLREYADGKLLVLDFWAKWCSPCVLSMDKWESFRDSVADGLAFIGVHLDYDYKALPFSKKRGWTSPSVIGGEASLINRHFFDRDVISRLVWIRDGRLLGITNVVDSDLEMLRRVLAGDLNSLPIDTSWTYQ